MLFWSSMSSISTVCWNIPVLEAVCCQIPQAATSTPVPPSSFLFLLLLLGLSGGVVIIALLRMLKHATYWCSLRSLAGSYSALWDTGQNTSACMMNWYFGSMHLLPSFPLVSDLASSLVWDARPSQVGDPTSMSKVCFKIFRLCCEPFSAPGNCFLSLFLYHHILVGQWAWCEQRGGARREKTNVGKWRKLCHSR